MFICLALAYLCRTNFTLHIDRRPPAIDVNTTVSSCFVLPASPVVSCVLGGTTLMTSPDIQYDVLGSYGIVLIKNWTSLDIINLNLITLQCNAGALPDSQTYRVRFYSLSKLKKIFFVFEM